MGRHQEGLLTALGFGGFLIIVGLVFALTPNLWQRVMDFFHDISTVTFPLGSSTSNIVLPAPQHSGNHDVLYTALLQFDVALGILQVIILGLRVWIHSTTRKIADTIGDAIFWLGSAALVNAFLLTGTHSSWFEYWATLIILVGVSFVARAIVYFVRR